MSHIQPIKEELTVSLGQALKQTFEELQKKNESLKKTEFELSLLKMQESTLSDENGILRDKILGFEELIEINKENFYSKLQEFKASHKLETMKVAKVLRRTLMAFKRSKALHEKMEHQNEALNKDIAKLKDLLTLKQKELLQAKEQVETLSSDNAILQKDKEELVKTLKSPQSPIIEEKYRHLEDSFKALKEKAKSAILQKEEELKKQKTLNLELQQKLQGEEEFKARQQLYQKKIEELLNHETYLINQVKELKIEQLNKNELHLKLEDSFKEKENEVERLSALVESLQKNASIQKDELERLREIKKEYDQMQQLVSNIKACMNIDKFQIQIPMKEDLSNKLIPSSKSYYQEELF